MKIKFSTIAIGVAGLGAFIYLVQIARSETQLKKYKCTGAPNYQCVEDPSGPYDSLVMCQAACVAPVLTSISITPPSKIISTGGSQLFTATAKDQYGNTMSGITINWSLSDSTKATVNPTSGVTNASGQTSTTLTAGSVAVSELILTATSGTKTGTATITITTVTPVLKSISLDPPSTINEGTQKQLTAVCTDQSDNVMDCPVLTWTSSNTSIATVSSTGLVTAKLVSATSNVTITAKHTRADGITISGTSLITVSDIPAVLCKIHIEPSTPTTLTPGGTVDITATCYSQSGSIMPACPQLSWHAYAPGTTTPSTVVSIAPITGYPNKAKVTASLTNTGSADVTAYLDVACPAECTSGCVSSLSLGTPYRTPEHRTPGGSVGIPNEELERRFHFSKMKAIDKFFNNNNYTLR